jgi:hypothetical protein
MPTSGRHDDTTSAPLRFVVWVLAAVYLGRVHYDNTLSDLRELTALHVVVRTLSIAITLGFAYWNLIVVPPRLAAVIWTTVAGLIGAVFVWKGIVETGVEYHDSLDPLNRRDGRDRAVESFDTGRRVAGKRLGDTRDDD